MNVLENYNYRDWLIKYFCVALKCNTHILEAIGMCSILECTDQYLLHSLSDPNWNRTGYPAYAYFLPIFAKNNWILVKQPPTQDDSFKATVTKHGIVMNIWGNNYEFHAAVDDVTKEGFYLYCWHLTCHNVRTRITSRSIEYGTNYRDWIDSLVKFIKG